jgi:Zn-finger nucleic acid-binding protein
MKCPVCESNLQMTERSGVEIDYCPACRGVWLDRGELDKIIQRSGSETGSGRLSEDRERHYDSDDSSRSRSRENTHPPKKRESFWSELFDFG